MNLKNNVDELTFKWRSVIKMLVIGWCDSCLQPSSLSITVHCLMRYLITKSEQNICDVTTRDVSNVAQ